MRLSPRGALNPAALITAHRKEEHGSGPDDRSHRPTGQRPTGRRRTKIPDGPTPLTVLSGTRDDLKGKRAPTADQLAAAMGKAFGYGTVLAAGSMVNGDPRITSEEDENAAVAMLSATPEEAKAIAHPIARYMAMTKLNATAGRQLVDNSDIFDAVYAATEVVTRLRRYSRGRAAYEAATAPTPMGPAGNGHTPQPVDIATARAAAAAAMPQSPPGTRGIVVTPEMIAGLNGQPRPGRIANAQEDY